MSTLEPEQGQEPESGENVPGRTGRRSYLIGYLWFSTGLLTVLVIAVVLLAFQNRSAISAQHRSDITQCQIANIIRAQDIAIWKEFLGDLPKLPAAASARINCRIQAKDTPRDCAAAYKGSAVAP